MKQLRNPVWIIAAFAALMFLFGSTLPMRLVLKPLDTLQTAIHETGHAVTCLATGGQVSGMTIVSDGQGAAGVTFCRGGWPIVYGQAGYLAETAFSCLLILLALRPTAARRTLVVLGVALAISTLVFMPGTIVNMGRSAEGIGSIVWGACLSAALIFAGAKLSDRWSYYLLLAMAAQSVLLTLGSHLTILTVSLAGGQSDAHILASATGLPAVFWAGLWCVVAVLALRYCLRYLINNSTTETPPAAS